MSVSPLTLSAAKVALILQTIIEMSDDVVKAQSPLDTQGRLLRLQSSIQKNKGRVAEHLAAVAKHLREENEAAS